MLVLLHRPCFLEDSSEGELLLIHGSLVPRPFPPPVFDRFQYKNGGGRPGRKSHVRDVR